jgi:uncharacterized protein with PIN domain
MKTKRFETEEDRQNELEVIEKFSAKGNFTYSKLDRHALDFAITKDEKVVAFAEVKCYKTPSDKYHTQIVSLYKWEKMKDYNKLAPTFFICRYSDGKILYMHAEEIKGDIKFSGRKVVREGSFSDREFCIFINRKEMREL